MNGSTAVAAWVLSAAVAGCAASVGPSPPGDTASATDAVCHFADAPVNPYDPRLAPCDPRTQFRWSCQGGGCSPAANECRPLPTDCSASCSTCDCAMGTVRCGYPMYCVIANGYAYVTCPPD